jgi:rhodanese-related sulfurtransferase
MSPADFVALVTADQPDAPPYFTYDAVLNSKERPTLEVNLRLTLKPLTLDRLLELQREGIQVLDVREPTEFGQGHLAGSINIGLSGQYATWAGTVLASEGPIAIVADPSREQEAATRLGRIGFDHIAGYLEGGMQALESRVDLLRTTERATADALAAELASPKPPFVLDVRTAREWRHKQIEGSVNIPLNQLIKRMDELPRNRRMWVHCAGGYRSSIGTSLLQLAGFDCLVELASGLAAWEAARLPLQGLEAEAIALHPPI